MKPCRRIRSKISALVFLLLVTVLAAFGDDHVTGKNSQDVTWKRGQSETAVNVSNVPGPKQIITVTYNDDTKTEQTILYGPSTRKVLAGASLMGWSNSVDGGVTWKYGGKVAPPAEWPVLWGDPSIESDFMDQRYVFMANLAVPASKMPKGGIEGPLNDFLGGGCIARSADGGLSFKIAQCVSSKNDFYDGSSIVAAGSPANRSVFVAFRDVTQNRIDVWASPSDTGAFQLLPDPFRSIPIGSHPRLRFDPDTDSLYVAALGLGDDKIYINRFTNNNWGSPVLASAYQTVGNPNIYLSDRVLRIGYQFSFDIGSASRNGDDDIRFAYTVLDQASNRFYIRGGYCRFDLSGCSDAPEWGTTPGNFNLEGDQFNPNVRAFRGFLSVPALWKLTYMTREDAPTGNTVAFRQGDLAVLPNGTRLFVPRNLYGDQLTCPDTRSTGGYWGDYNDLQFAGLDQNNLPLFMLAFSDSTKGCLVRWTYVSHHVHVTGVIFH